MNFCQMIDAISFWVSGKYCTDYLIINQRLFDFAILHTIFTVLNHIVWHCEPGLSGDVWNISCVGPGYVGARLLLEKPESEGRVHQVVVECCQLGCCKWAFWLVVQAELSWRTVDTGRDHTGAGAGGFSAPISGQLSPMRWFFPQRT